MKNNSQKVLLRRLGEIFIPGTAHKPHQGHIQQYRGRIVGTAGDSLLEEFASVVDAV